MPSEKESCQLDAHQQLSTKVAKYEKPTRGLTVLSLRGRVFSLLHAWALLLQRPPPGLRCPETLFISHEHTNFLFSVFRVVQGEAKTPKIMGCCRAIFAFLHALKIGTFRGK